MQFNLVLIFDIESEYGHFRKFNTTTSPLTYSFPTRPALVGLLGAILGIEREVSAGVFSKGTVPLSELFAKKSAGIAVQILRPVSKVNIAFNLLDTEKRASSFFNVKQRTQVEFELLKNPMFRIFVSMADDTLFKSLCEKVRNNASHFTPYLGLSQFTATMCYRDVANITGVATDLSTEVVSAVNISELDQNDPIQFNYSSDFKYTADTMPVAMKSDRQVVEYAEVVIETNGRSIYVKSDNIKKVEGYGNIIFL